ncbi:MAG: prephenate dehydratase [Gorillibacterium sp.]|nr:prephenate dehydratase [Gorillibacterium sp.]
MKKIAFLGPKGTVSEEAVRHFLRGTEQMYSFIPYKNVADCFQATESGDADWMVAPIENAIEGSVNLHMDLLIHENKLPIRAEWVYPSVQNLIGRNKEVTMKGPVIEGISKIISIPVATAQCRKFLSAALPDVEQESASSTAEGVRIVSQSEGQGIAAIGTKLAAEIYGLDVLAADITDYPNNFTRFVLVGSERPKLPPSHVTKTTIVVNLAEDHPGALHQLISAFAWRRINLTKIESRPTKRRLGSYFFYIDIELSLDSVLLQAAFSEIEALGCQVRVIGSYPTYSYQPAEV